MSPIKLSFRRAAADDAVWLAAHRFSFGEAPQDRELRERYARWVAPKIERAEYIGWLGCAEDRVVAGAGAVLLDWGPHDAGALRARLCNVFTDAAWRRRGVAGALVQRVVDDVRAAGIRAIGLSASDAGAVLYRRMGFEPSASEMLLRL